jgi:multidrug efflux pump subunit AcrA (membrane-fusion protein)
MQQIKNIVQKLFMWYGKRNVISIVGVVIALVAIGLFFKFHTVPVVAPATLDQKTVTLATAGGMKGSDSSLSILGTIESTHEARLQAEAGGRVTAVRVSLGDKVAAGTVLASIENSRESAVLLQAQGAYEAARAGANAGDVGLAQADRAEKEARTAAQNTYRSAFTTADSVVHSTLDQLFSSGSTAQPGLRVDGRGEADSLNAERVNIGALLASWKAEVDSDPTGSNAEMLLASADTNTRRIAAFATTLSNLYSKDVETKSSIPSDLTAVGPLLTAARGQLDGALAALSGSRSALSGAATALAQAKISAQDGGASLTDAQLTQALGSLRLAQANYEKTIIRTPISGTVQSLTIKEGTSVSIGQPAAIISNESAREVVAYVSESDAAVFSVGSKVTIENTISGVVTQVASAIDPLTKKVEVRIGMNDDKNVLTNGQSVTVTTETSTAAATTDTTLRLPIIALKMTPDGAVVFTVDNDKKLVQHAVVLGAILGDTVVIASGIDATTSIVTDARGLRTGETVTVK